MKKKAIRIFSGGLDSTTLIYKLIHDAYEVLEAPFIRMNKTDIVQLGQTLQVPYQNTWSCYKGREKHCGKCGTCVERKEAFLLAGMNDPTVYE